MLFSYFHISEIRMHPTIFIGSSFFFLGDTQNNDPSYSWQHLRFSECEIHLVKRYHFSTGLLMNFSATEFNTRYFQNTLVHPDVWCHVDRVSRYLIAPRFSSQCLGRDLLQRSSMLFHLLATRGRARMERDRFSGSSAFALSNLSCMPLLEQSETHWNSTCRVRIEE